MPNAAELTREQVLLAAAGAGFPITGDQLARWHRAGLLPRPRQRSLGRGLGTVTIYPAGTVEQLVALCRVRQQHRSLTRAAFQLWWDGFPVDPEQVWGPLGEVATKFDSDLAGAATLQVGPAKGLTAVVNRRLGPQRREALETAIRAASQHPSGALTPFPDLDLPSMPPSIDELVALLLPIMIGALSGLSAVDLVKNSSIDDLCATRDEAKLVFDSIGRWAEPMAWLWGQKGTVFQLLAEIPKAIGPADLPDVLFAFLLLRRVVPPEIRALVLTPPPPLLREIAALKTIRDRVPGADSVITPMAIRALLRGNEAAKRHGPKITSFMQEHEPEVRSVIEPDLLSTQDTQGET